MREEERGRGRRREGERKRERGREGERERVSIETCYNDYVHYMYIVLLLPLQFEET